MKAKKISINKKNNFLKKKFLFTIKLYIKKIFIIMIKIFIIADPDNRATGNKEIKHIGIVT